MKKRYSTFILSGFLLFCCTPAARAQDTLRITSVGFGGYYDAAMPTPVQVHVPASGARSVQLQFTVRSGFRNPRVGFLRTDHFSQDVSTTPGQPVDICVPLLLPQAERVAIELDARDEGAQVIGHTSTELDPLNRVLDGQWLVGAFCESDSQCQSVESEITQSGTETERTAKDHRLRWSVFTNVSRLPPYWWAYRPAHYIVIAAPISSIPPAQLAELEKFARAGGVLMLVESAINDPDFLAAYRQGTAPATMITLGFGGLVRVPDIAGLSQTKMLTTIGEDTIELPTFPALSNPVLNRIGIFFRFPPLRALLIWLALYIVIVGPVNFTLLRYFGRLEWGWATVCILAVIFAAGSYLVGSARRPKDLTLDQVALFRMDSRSGVAAEDLSVRLSSPHRESISFAVRGSLLPVSLTRADSPESEADIGLSLTGAQALQQGWNIALGARDVLTLSMLRWSFRDFRFFGFREFPGTVHWTSPGHLRNDTGQTFREAIYIDEHANRQTLLPRIAPGEEIDVASLHSEPIWKATVGAVQVRYPHAALPSEAPFSVAEVPYLGLPFRRAQVFVGLADSRMAAASWITPGSDRRAVSLTVVELGAP
jgi:hypothetical protein